MLTQIPEGDRAAPPGGRGAGRIHLPWPKPRCSLDTQPKRTRIKRQNDVDQDVLKTWNGVAVEKKSQRQEGGQKLFIQIAEGGRAAPPGGRGADRIHVPLPAPRSSHVPETKRTRIKRQSYPDQDLLKTWKHVAL